MHYQGLDGGSDDMTALHRDQLQVSPSKAHLRNACAPTDICRGTITTSTGKLQVVVKVYRTQALRDDQDFEHNRRRLEQLMWREISALRKAQHERIIRFYGMCTVDGSPCLVMEYMKGGSLLQYLSKHPNADKIKLLLQVAEGVQYLHEEAMIVHGNIYPDSVLVSDSGDAVIWDFELSMSIFPDETLGVIAGTERLSDWLFTAPEIIAEKLGPEAGFDMVGESPYMTPEADLYSFGMLVLSVFMGKAPWEGKMIRRLLAFARGELPPRPEHPEFSDALWSLCQSCLSQDRRLRPSASRVLSDLLRIRDRGTVYPTHEESSIQDKTDARQIDHPVEEELRDRDSRDPRSRPSIPEDHGPAFEAPSRTDLYKQLLDQRIRCTLNGIEADINIPVQEAFGRGGMGVLLKGHVLLDEGVTVVAVKVCKAHKTTDRERDIWSTLKHENVLQLCGVFEFTCKVPRSRWGIRCTCFVSQFMQRGNLIQYLESNGQADRLRLMSDVANGVSYLHNDMKIVHGDIKPENILIADDGRALLTDFGLSTTVAAAPEHTGYEIRQLFTLAYCAPEIVDDAAEYAGAPGRKRSKTTMSDMFSYGMLVYETYAGGLSRAGGARFRLIGDLYDGRIPPRPARSDSLPAFCDELWSICTRCWERAPEDRPVIAVVLLELQELRSSPDKLVIVTEELSSSPEKQVIVTEEFESQLWYLLLVGIFWCVHLVVSCFIGVSRRIFL